MIGVDLSHHQDPASLPWDAWRGTVGFVFARAAYGLRRDKHVEEHVRRARDIGAKVGLYLFVRTNQPIDAQFALLCDVAEACGIVPGDIVPALDIERDPFSGTGSKPDPGRDVRPEWSAPCERLAQQVQARFGDCIVYITAREWRMLGKPRWVLDRPLWVAHYTDAAAPASPGGADPDIWQHRVASLAGSVPIDQNRLLGRLPLIPGEPPGMNAEDRARAAGVVAMTMADEVRDLVESNDRHRHDGDDA